jgi:excisionase family DNA binding protein
MDTAAAAVLAERFVGIASAHQFERGALPSRDMADVLGDRHPPNALGEHARRLEDAELLSTSLLLTVTQVADRLGCGRTFVDELIGTGELEAVKLGRLRRIPASALDALVQRLRVDIRDT